MKNHTGLLFLLLVAPLCLLGQTTSLSHTNNRAALEWFKDAGLGLRIHLGLESQLGISMGQSLIGASADFQKKFFEELPQSFNPRHLEASELVRLAKLAGVQYMIFTVKDESGFCLWNTASTDFNIMHTPYGKDLLLEYTEAVRAAGLKVGLQYSTEDYHFLFQHELPIKATLEEELDEELLESYQGLIEAQCQELFSKYGKIDILFLEGQGMKLAAKKAGALQKDLLVTGGAIPTWAERLPGKAHLKSWEVSFSMADQWSFKPRPAAKSAQDLIKLLIETRTLGGTALLTVGLRPDGRLSEEEERSLREVAAWSFINREAMEGIRPWIIHQEGSYGLARKREATDVFVYISPKEDWPLGEERSLILRSVRATKDSEVSILGQAAQIPGIATPSVRFKQEGDQLQINCTRWHQVFDNGRWPHPIVLKITRAEPTLTPPVVQTLPPKRQSQNIELKGFLAQKGDQGDLQLGFEYRPSPVLFASTPATWIRTEWVESSPNGHFNWSLPSLSAGEYEVRAIVRNPVVEVPGEILRFTIP